MSLLGSSDARTLLAAADGFVLDSFFEGWPVAATEAASMGLSLVLSDFGGARELIARDPSHSVLIPNPCGLADACRTPLWRGHAVVVGTSRTRRDLVRRSTELRHAREPARARFPNPRTGLWKQ